MDMGRIESTGDTVTLNGQAFDNVVSILDINPLVTCAEDEEIKLYAPGIGEIKDVDIEFVSFTPAP